MNKDYYNKVAGPEQAPSLLMLPSGLSDNSVAWESSNKGRWAAYEDLRACDTGLIFIFWDLAAVTLRGTAPLSAFRNLGVCAHALTRGSLVCYRCEAAQKI